MRLVKRKPNAVCMIRPLASIFNPSYACVPLETDDLSDNRYSPRAYLAGRVTGTTL